MQFLGQTISWAQQAMAGQVASECSHVYIPDSSQEATIGPSAGVGLRCEVDWTRPVWLARKSRLRGITCSAFPFRAVKSQPPAYGKALDRGQVALGQGCETKAGQRADCARLVLLR